MLAGTGTAAIDYRPGGSMPAKLVKRLLIASPRGFCAGVERAIAVVDRLLDQAVSPLYVRKEIVHNLAVVEDFRRRGVVFVDDLDEIPDGATVVFSAHGISPDVRREAERRSLRTIDATCPLVTRVHDAVIRYSAADLQVVLIGHPGHDEVLGTMGEAPDSITLITDKDDVDRLEFPPHTRVAYVTQTTLSVDETLDIVQALRNRFPELVVPPRSDICFATQNRQDAVKALVELGIEHLLVVGSANSSNSMRLCEVAQKLSVPASLVDGPDDVQLSRLADHSCIGLTAGASAPEHLVAAVVQKLRDADWQSEQILTLEEEVRFSLPKELRDDRELRDTVE